MAAQPQSSLASRSCTSLSFVILVFVLGLIAFYCPLSYFGQQVNINETTPRTTCATVASELNLYPNHSWKMKPCCIWIQSVRCVLYQLNCSKYRMSTMPQLVSATQATCGSPISYSITCGPLPKRISTSSFIHVMEKVNIISITVPSFLGGTMTLLGIRRRLKHFGVLSLQLKFVAGIGVCGVARGCASSVFYSFYWGVKFLHDVIMAINIVTVALAIAFTTGIGLVLAAVIYDPVAYYNHFNRGRNPAPQATAGAAVCVLLSAAVCLMSRLHTGDTWSSLIYACLPIWTALIFGAPAYSWWKLIRGEWLFDPKKKAKLLHHLVTVCVVSSICLSSGMLVLLSSSMTRLSQNGPLFAALRGVLFIFA